MKTDVVGEILNKIEGYSNGSDNITQTRQALWEAVKRELIGHCPEILLTLKKLILGKEHIDRLRWVEEEE